MSKEELELMKKELQKELNSIQSILNDYMYEEKKKKYGDKFNCKYCKYSAVKNITEHNECAGGYCTCCNDDCEKYEPDNDFTSLIKSYTFSNRITNKQFYLDEEQYKALVKLSCYFLKAGVEGMTLHPELLKRAYHLLSCYLSQLEKEGRIKKKDE